MVWEGRSREASPYPDFEENKGELMNALKTTLLLGLLSGLVLFAGEMIGGTTGLEYGLVAAVAMNVFSYFFSDKLSLMTYSAQPVTPQEHPEIYARVAPIVQGLAQRMNIPMPKLWLIPDPSPNAFATGRNPEARLGRVHGRHPEPDDRPGAGRSGGA